MRFDCPNCGQIDKALVDGYGIGDRLLEDVWFEIVIDGKKLKVKVDDDAKDYFDQFDSKLWYDIVEKEVRNGHAECPNCHEEIKLIP